jgi:putative polymerase
MLEEMNVPPNPAPSALRSRFHAGETMAAVILIAAVLFNAALAIVNGHVMALTQTHVALGQAVIIASAIGVIAFHTKRAMAPWLLLSLIIVAIQCCLVAFSQVFSAKSIGDAIMIPIFVMLGMIYARGNIVRLFGIIQLLVLFFMLMEVLSLDLFSNIFQIVRYYINTRGFSQSNFWNPDVNLFVSATRPNERFLLPFLNLHRMSSIFLEPVSLENYCVLATIFTAAFWSRMTSWTKLFFVVSTIVLLVGSDGRMATVTCAILVAGVWIFPRLPPYSPVLYLPAVVVAAFVCVAALHWSTYNDDFGGRAARSVQLLSNLSVDSFLGLNPMAAIHASDTGVAYFVLTQSIVGAVAIWLFICLVPSYRRAASTIVVHGMCLYISLNLLVSDSMFSIKTAAPMWFVYGYIVDSGLLRRPAFPRLMSRWRSRPFGFTLKPRAELV